VIYQVIGAQVLTCIFIVLMQAKETVKVLSLAPPLWKRGARGDFITKTFYCNINELLFCKIPLNPEWHLLKL